MANRKRVTGSPLLSQPRDLPGILRASLLADLSVLLSHYGISGAMGVFSVTLADYLIQHLRAVTKLMRSGLEDLEIDHIDRQWVMRDVKRRRP